MIKKLLIIFVLLVPPYSNCESARWSLDSKSRVAYLGGSMIKPPFDPKYSGTLVRINFEDGTISKIFDSKYIDNLSISNSGNYLLFSLRELLVFNCLSLTLTLRRILLKKIPIRLKYNHLLQ